MVCLDTTFLADFTRKSPEAIAKLRGFLRSGERVCVSTITVGELYKGAYAHATADAKVRELEEVLRLLTVLEVTFASAQMYGQLSASLQRQGRSVGERDVFIAATALAYGETRIVTRNARDFERIPGIEVVAY